ncbi:MAG: Stp1/IreP family PP2C-type Ser/Thr phosphatase [Actinomycetota bacterium]|nr:Stp1/IreP family PP2C-type Ser/Thr phosphatase [Actinomycetota bacterium]
MTAINYGSKSEVGLVRDINEDSILASPPLFAVADGMGGHRAGDVASQLAIERLKGHAMDGQEALMTAVRDANSAIYDKGRADPALSGMGTTITAMLATETAAQIAHVGDSRAYLFRDGVLKRLTQDHTYVGKLVEQGRLTEEEAERHPKRSMLERALGVGPDVTVDMNLLDMNPGDRILLCSDGLHGMIDEATITSILASEKDPQQAAGKLCNEAVGAGGHDNVTAIVVDFNGPARPAVSTTDSSSVAPSIARTKTEPLPVGKKKRKMTAYLVAIALLLIASAMWGKIALAASWYVGESSGKVAIFNGFPGKIAGIGLAKRSRTTSLRSASLPAIYRRQLADGMKANDLTDAQKIVANLTRIANSAGPNTGYPSEQPTATATASVSPSMRASP